MPRRRSTNPKEWPRPPPTITTVLEAATDKIRSYRQDPRWGAMTIEDQLATVDYWIGQLHELRARIAWGKRI